MIPASVPIQRPADARLLVVDSGRQIRDLLRSSFPTLLHSGDIVVANDAATLPASIFGVHKRSGRSIEVRLAGSESVFHEDVRQFSAVVFGEGDYRTPTERRPSPPELRPGDTLQLGPLTATVLELLGHPRFVMIRFEGPSARIWEGLARHGHPIQYSHIPAPLAVWDTWTPIAGPPVAFEPPSARLRPGLAHPRRHSSARGPLCDHYTCCWNLVDGRRRTGCTSSLRRALSNNRIHCAIDPACPGSWRTPDCRRHNSSEGLGTCSLHSWIAAGNDRSGDQ